MSTSTIESLRSFPFLSRLSPEELAAIRPCFVVRKYDKGDIVFLEDEPCRGLYLVASGHIRIYKASPDGREQVLTMVGPGESFNEVPNFDGGPNPASAEAVEPTTLFFVRRDDVLRIAECYPRVAMAMLGIFARRLRHLTTMVEDLSFKHVTSRLAKILLEYAAEPQPHGHTEAELKRRLTQQEMAAMIGTAREMVGRSLKSLEAQGALRVDRHRIVITNRDLLRRLV